MIHKLRRFKIIKGGDLTQLEKLFVCLMLLAIVKLVAIENYQDVIQERQNRYLHYTTSGINDPENVSFAERLGIPKPMQIDHAVRPSLKEELDEKYELVLNDSNDDIKYRNEEQQKLNTNHSLSVDGEQPNLKTNGFVETPSNDSEYDPTQRPLSKMVTSNTSDCLPVPTSLYVPSVSLNDCSSPHVIIHHGGQLGNKMCQYISLYLLRHIYGIRVSITEKMKQTLGYYFKNITLPVQDFKCFTKWTKRIMYDDLYKKLYSKAMKNMERQDGNPESPLLDNSYYVFHHPCPREVITEHRELVREALSFQDDVLKKAKRNIKKGLKYLNRTLEDSTVITVHVRRRDYTQYMLKHYNMTQLNEVYFQRAFDYYRQRVKNPVFLVVSDDHSWCRKVLEGRDVVVAGSRKDPIIDMALLSLGDHHIISYGTFSFMGATLGRGSIVHPLSNNKLYHHYKCVDPRLFIPVSRDA